MSDTARLVIATIVLVALIVVGYFVIVGLSGPVGKLEVQRKTNGSDYGIAHYDTFKDNCNAIVALETKIDRAKETVDEDRADGVDSGQLSRDKQNRDALENTRDELIANYNADAQKTATAAKWQASDLPRRIDPNGETSCE